MNQQQKEVLTILAYQLRTNVNEKSEIYEHTVHEDDKEATYQVDREKHLEEIMKWAVQELENNFELENK